MIIVLTSWDRQVTLRHDDQAFENIPPFSVLTRNQAQ